MSDMYIQLHDNISEHPKTLKCARSLKIPVVQMVGHLACLWTWTLRMASDGEYSSFDHDDIELGAKWEGEPGLMVATLKKHRFLEERKGVLYVHDWDIYAESIKKRNQKRKERERQSLNVARQSSTVAECRAEQNREEQRGTEQNRHDIYKIQKSVPKDYSSSSENSFIDWVHARDVFSAVRKRYGHGSYKPTGYGKYTDKLTDVASWANAESEESEWKPLQLVELSAAGFVVSANEAAKGAKYNPAFWWGDPGAHLAVGFQELLRWKIALLRGEIRELQQTGKRDHDTISEIERISGVIAGLNAEISTYGERPE